MEERLATAEQDHLGSAASSIFNSCFAPHRVDVACIVVLCVLSFLNWMPRRKGPIDLRWDAGTYFILGTSLADGKGYRLMNEPGEIRADQYPPLLPVIVAAHEKLLHSKDPVRVGIALRQTWIVFSFFYILGAFLLTRLFLPPIYAFWVSLVCMTNFDMYYLATLCFAELPFAVMTVLFVWSYLRRGGTSWTRHIAPVFAIAAYLLRTMGIAVLFAWVADALLRRQYRSTVIRAIVIAVPVLAWQAYVHDVESGPDYMHPYYAYQRDPSMFYNVSYGVNMKLKAPFDPDLGSINVGDFCYRVFQNSLFIPSALGQSISARDIAYKGQVNAVNRLLRMRLVPHWPYKIVLYLLGLLALAGAVRLFMQRHFVISLIVLLTIAEILTAPWPAQFNRYLAATLPLLLLAVLAGVGLRFENNGQLFSGRRSGRLRILQLAVMGLIFCESVLAMQSGIRNFLDPAYFRDASGHRTRYRLIHYSPGYEQAERALAWLVPRAEPNAVIAVSMPQWVYLQSGLKSVMPPLTRDPDRGQELIDTVPVSYVMVEQLLMNDNFNTFFPRLVENSPHQWKLIYSKPGSEIKIYGRVGIARLSGVTLTD